MCLGWSMKLVDLELYFASRQCMVAEPARRASELGLVITIEGSHVRSDLHILESETPIC